MDSDEAKRLVKRIAIIASFFLLAAVLSYFKLRRLLMAYVLIVTVLMVLVVLLQSGRGGGLASLGGLGGDSLFGTRSATPIAKATYVMGALFLFICMLLARMGSQAPPTKGVLPGEPDPVRQVDTPEGSTGQPDEKGEEPQTKDGEDTVGGETRDAEEEKAP